MTSQNATEINRLALATGSNHGNVTHSTHNGSVMKR